MVRHLFIAGHGYQRNGTFDPGATGYITKGEYRYMVQDLFPAIKRVLPKHADVVFYDARKVSNWGNLKAIVDQYNADEVTEFHFDAHVTGSSARGGHVIIHSAYAPDKVDLALRDAIQSMVGARYSHRGYSGISGRNNLYNVNDARNRGITYRLLELGFGTNRTDANIMTGSVDAYARAIVNALFGSTGSGSSSTSTPAPKKTAPKKSSGSKSISKMADEVEAGKHGTGHANRQKSLGVDNATYQKVRAEVNRRAGISSAPKKSAPKKSAPKKQSKSIAQMATEVINGQHGTGHANRRRSLGVNQATYNKVRAEVNRRAGGGSSAPRGKSISQMATEVLRGQHGNGHANRQRSLGVNNATYQKVRAEVNRRS